MADKQALNATFFAFRKRERGGVLTTLTLAYLVAAIAIGAVFFLLNAQGILDYVHWIATLGANAEAAKPAEPSAMGAFMPPPSVMALGPAYLLFLLVFYVLFAAYEAGCLRWMIRGETGGLFGLSLGADTWRVYFTYWVWFFLLILFYIVIAILIGGTVASLVATTGGDIANAGAGAGIIPLLIVLLICFGLIYFGVRFAPAAATSVARKKFAFFDAWTVSKGRFWALFGAFLLLFLMFFVLYIIVSAGLGMAIAGIMMSQVGQGGEPQSPEDVFRLFANPQVAITIGVIMLVMTVASMMLYVAMFGINARAAALALEEGKIKAEA
ncbi:MAG: hypothetical protein K2P58_12685 [Hyphomonadaceae bacterium]|nr:hypothetical protein [Hyphomonadaceae bacterium]